jgi:replicative DNA helicase
VGNGGAEQGHDAVAQHLVDGALEAVDGVHHQPKGRIEELLGGFGVEALDKPGRVLEVGEEDGDLFALAFQGVAGGQNLVGEMGRGVGQRRGVWLTRPARCRGGGWRGRGRRVARPDQDGAPLIGRQALALDEFVLQIFQGRVVELELALQGAVGQASAPLEHGNRVVENLLEGHRRPSTALALVPRQRNVRHGGVYQGSAPRVYQESGGGAGEIARRRSPPDRGATGTRPETLLKPRSPAEVERQVLRMATVLGEDAFYAWGSGKNHVEGGSINLAAALILAWGNAVVEAGPVQETAESWIFTHTFVDLERGVSMTRQFRQPKGEPVYGHLDAYRKEMINFGKGQSRSIRNVILMAMPQYLVTRALEIARQGARVKMESFIREKGLAAAQACTLNQLRRVGVPEDAVLAKTGKAEVRALDLDDLVALAADFKSIDSGQESAASATPRRRSRPRTTWSSPARILRPSPPASSAGSGSITCSARGGLGMAKATAPLPPTPGSWFYDARHRLIYDAMLTLVERREPVDLASLTDVLGRRGLLERAGGSVYLAELTEAAVTTANVTHHARMIKDKALLALATAQAVSAFTPMQALMLEAWHAAQHATAQDLQGLDTGFHDLNALTGGFHRADLIVLAARPSMGKSALAMQFAVAAARAHEALPVAVFSLEMSKHQLGLRLLCGEARIEMQRVCRGLTSGPEWARLGDAAERLRPLPLLFDDSASLTVLDLRSRSKRLQLDQGLGMIVVDYLQLLTPGRRRDNRQQEVSEISRDLKVLAKELDVPVLALSQLSRDVERRHPPVPQLSDLRDSGAIEQDADVVLFIYRGDLYEPRAPEVGAQLLVARQRIGPTGVVKLRFDADAVSFDTLAYPAHHQLPIHGSN